MSGRKTIDVYHGTYEQAAVAIFALGLLPMRDPGYVYVTTEPKIARKYAWAWTGARMYQRYEGHDNGADLQGAIIKIRVRPERLIPDDYNPSGEPNQFKIRGKVTVLSWAAVEFPEFSDRDRTLQAMCYWLGIARD